MLTISEMTLEDLPSIYPIEARAHLVPWERSVMESLFSLQGVRVKAKNEKGELVGFAMLSTILDEAHLLNIAIDPHFQGLGYGRALLQAVMERLEEEGFYTLLLEVREGNRAAISLYDSEGFNQIGRRARYYPLPDGGREDALVMMYTFLS